MSTVSRCTVPVLEEAVAGPFRHTAFSTCPQAWFSPTGLCDAPPRHGVQLPPPCLPASSRCWSWSCWSYSQSAPDERYLCPWHSCPPLCLPAAPAAGKAGGWEAWPPAAPPCPLLARPLGVPSAAYGTDLSPDASPPPGVTLRAALALLGCMTVVSSTGALPFPPHGATREAAPRPFPPAPGGFRHPAPFKWLFASTMPQMSELPFACLLCCCRITSDDFE